MEKEISHKLVKETFENEFNEIQFSKFIVNILKNIDTDKKFQYRGAYIPEAFISYIKSYERLATYTDPNGKKIDILIVNLKKDSSLDRARTAQRNFVAHHLKNRDNKDAALVAFTAPESKEWRFSFIKMEYKFVQNESGGAKVEEEFTPARRWSFLVGEHENSHTAQSRFAPILQNDKNPTLKDLEECFDIEKVTKEFFEKYRELYLKFKDKLDEIVENNQNIKGDFDKKGVDTVEFAKKLLGQIVFLYFLQKKGWFGVERDKPWGTGPKNYLRKLFNDKGNDKNFFNNVLEPLFYEALALKRECNFYNAFNCKIPFLNGGLFDPINNYDWVHTDILLPDCLFSNKEKTAEGDSGTGILDVFDRYNFTVKEDEPLEREVAVDPEMLGKVFENLLDVKDRKSKGTYYTPREIVHYMCVQSLVNYLTTELEGKVTKEECETLIKNGESVSENEARVEDNKKETATYSYKLPESIRNHAKLIDEKLANIKVCDPAIGSGAFPLGMMAEIVRTRLVLSNYVEIDEQRTPYTFKRHCIQNSLYGVDIDPGAIQIAKLRLWLSLVVDEDNFEEIRPLPNLDYKIMQGNSLLQEYDGVSLFDDALIPAPIVDNTAKIAELKSRQREISLEYIELHQTDQLTPEKKKPMEEELEMIKSQLKELQQPAENNKKDTGLFTLDTIKQLKKLHEDFFLTAEKDKKEKLKKEIDEKEWELIKISLETQGRGDRLEELKSLRERNVKPYFLWKLNFMEVFQEKGGFDVVIANPPYVSYGLRNTQSLTKEEKRTLRISFPNSAEYKISLYALFIDKAIQLSKNTGGIQTYIVPDSFLLGKFFSKIRNYILCSNEIKNILLFNYSIFDATVGFSVVYVLQKKNIINKNNKLSSILVSDNSDLDSCKYKEFSYSQEYFNTTTLNRFYLFFEESSMNLISNIKKNSVSLGSIVKFSSGLIGKNGQDSIISDTKKGKNWLPGIISGGEINRYIINRKEKFLLHDKDFIKSGYECVKYFEDKLFLRQTGDSLICAYDTNNLLALNNIHIGNITNNKYCLKFIISVINSKLLNYYYRITSLELGRPMAQTDIDTIEQLPIHETNLKDQKIYSDIVDKILTITITDGYIKNKSLHLEVLNHSKKLDQMIYSLYGLTPKEIEIVERHSEQSPAAVKRGKDIELEEEL